MGEETNKIFVVSADILGRQATLVQACRENARLSRAVANAKCTKYLPRTEPSFDEAFDELKHLCSAERRYLPDDYTSLG